MSASVYGLCWRRCAALLRNACCRSTRSFCEEVSRGDRWSLTERQAEILDTLKSAAREQGLWNFWLTDSDQGYGLSTVEYAWLAEETGRAHLAAEAFNCSAPDTGNMEVLERYGTPQQKERWLKPLLGGEIRSAYAMTEPNVASSDATNISTSAVLENGEWLINGEKTYASGAGDRRCKILICMVKTNPENDRHTQHSQILIPIDTPGVEIVRGMQVFATDDAPHGHMHIRLKDVRVPEDNIILGPGRGFEIAQGRLGPGRIHHCMRAIGMAERALQLMCERAVSRTAFGKPLAKLGGNYDVIANARINIDMARLLTLQGRARHRHRRACRKRTRGFRKSRPRCRRLPSRSSTTRYRCTARPASRRTFPLPRCIPMRARCGSPTARTKSIAWLWRAASSHLI